jgi:phytoene dehydrogenase-like protein
MSTVSQFDVIVIGSGPNGLAAAVELARAGLGVLVVEARDTIGGGTRTEPLTLPGFMHDVCSAVHPMGILSPLFRRLPLEDHGLCWIRPPASAAHPLPDGRVAILYRSLARTGETLGVDARAYTHMIEPFLRNPHVLLGDLLGPLGWPKAPRQFARFGLLGLRSAVGLARSRFKDEAARGLFAGCAAHSILPLDAWMTAAVGLVFAITGHVEEWPVAAGGSSAITHALASLLVSLGGTIETGRPIRTLGDLPPARAVVFDTSPHQLANIAGDQLPSGYVRRLSRYRYGPGAFKLDWALSGPIPWRNPLGAQASTVHVGGTLDEVAAAEYAAWHGDHHARPFVMLTQQSLFDPTRAPQGKHTGYAYCHVPAGSTVDMTSAIEGQIERFAPGFRDLILARHTTTPADFERGNANYVGGAITGGAADITQLFTRPVARFDPYTTPNPKLFLCSASTPPGGGVHGMCGYHAARSVQRRLLAYSR